jgi:multicomponent Na+:H+ antiporter subunit D
LALHGRGRALWPTSVIWLVAALSLAGPPFVGCYLGHSLIGDSAGDVGYEWIAPVLALATILSTAPMLRAWARIFRGWGPKEDELLARPMVRETAEAPPGRSPLFFLLPAATLTLASLAVGSWSGLAARTEQVAAGFAQRAEYAAAVLDGRPAPHHALPVVPTTASGLLWAVVSVAGAVALAAFALLRTRVPRRVQRPLAVLRLVHSGHVNDYVAWLVLGTAVLGGLFALTLR